MKNTDIVFMSNEKIVSKEEDFIKCLIRTYEHTIIVIGMGNKGALIYDKNKGNIYIYIFTTKDS